MPNRLLGGFQVPHLFGRYSLPDVMGRLFHHGSDGGAPMQPTQYTGGLSGGSYTPGNTGIVPPDLNFNGYTGGDPMTPSTTTLNPGTPNIPIDPTLAPMDFTIHGPSDKGGSGSSGSTGAYTGGTNGGGMYTSGTLGGGYAVDPSQWGSFGLGGDSGPQNGGFGPGYQLALMSGGMHEGGFGGGALAGALAARRQTGGALPPQAAQNALTGGGLAPQRVGGPQTGGGYPAQPRPFVNTGGGMQPMPVQPNRLGGNFDYGYRPGQRFK